MLVRFRSKVQELPRQEGFLTSSWRLDQGQSLKSFDDELSALRKRLDDAKMILGFEALAEKKDELEKLVSDVNLWDDPDHARKVTAEYSSVNDDLTMISDLARDLEDAETLYDLGKEEGDDSLETEIEASVQALAKEFDSLELRLLFSGEYDAKDAVCEIHAGVGGTDAQDWAEMMLRMYLRWAERRGFEVEIDEVSPGQEAGILSATMIIRGRFAYGLLRAEKGVHRLVRISPFGAVGKRQTSFSSFDAVPYMDEMVDEISIDEKELRIDTYRSSGAGGQHVNVTDSAVRITHLPSGIVVSCQNERSQHQNKAKAMQILAAKLVERQRQQRRAEIDAIAGPQSEVGWGNQIRSYVLAPYQLVKDLRTGTETGNVDAVLDGDLDNFMESYLRWERSGGNS